MAEYKSLQNVAYDYLREMIYSRELEFGKIYSETRLATQLSISRTPIRDALNRLVRERYIEILPNRGFKLHEPDLNDIREAYHVRMMIECYCGENLAHDIQTAKAQATLAQMQARLDQQISLLDSESSMDLRKFWVLDEEFHFEPLNYMNISAFSTQFDTFLHTFMPQHLKNDYVLGRKHSTISEHRNIIQCIQSGDGQRTKEAIARHLNSTLHLSMLNLNEKQEK